MIFGAAQSIRLMNKLYKKNIIFLPKTLYFINRIVFACDVRPNSRIDSTVEFPHNGLGVVIHRNAIIGKSTKILHNVTIGGVEGKFSNYNSEVIDCPVVGANVLIGAGAIILGPIIIGDNSTIAAGAIVTKDVESNTVVAGNPAVLIKTKSS